MKAEIYRGFWRAVKPINEALVTPAFKDDKAKDIMIRSRIFAKDPHMENKFAENLKVVQSHLLQMHRLLMASLKSDMEKMLGKEITSTEWMQMMISRQEFAWMKPILTMMSDIDALMDHYEVTEHELRIIRQDLESLFLKNNGEPESFNRQYLEVIKKDPDVILFHGQLRKSILSLPQGEPIEDTVTIRKKWHVRPKRH